MTRGDIVARIADPVHAGRVVSIASGGLVNVRWFGTREVLEFAIPEAKLTLADDWKSGQAKPASLPFAVEALAMMARK